MKAKFTLQHYLAPVAISLAHIQADLLKIKKALCKSCAFQSLCTWRPVHNNIDKFKDIEKGFLSDEALAYHENELATGIPQKLDVALMWVRTE